MTQFYASMDRPAAKPKPSANPHGYSLLAGLLILVFATLGAGCASVPPAPPQIVEKPVYVPCVTGAPIVRPEFEFSKLGAAASDGDKILALARDWPRGRAYEGLLEAAVAGCR